MALVVKDDFEDLPETPVLSGKITILSYKPVFSGPFSCVYRGKTKEGGNMVAVKVLNVADGTAAKSVSRRLERERKAWGALRHPNILPLYGLVDGDELFGEFGGLISPWLELGDAAGFLAGQGHKTTLRTRFNLWKDVIAGLQYLHSHTPNLVHGDLKPRNILIEESGHAKICGFGTTRNFFDEEGGGRTTTALLADSERYLAHELVATDDEVHPTTASDVHALGCLGLEFILLRIPYSTRKNNFRGAIYADIKAGIPPAQCPPDLNPSLQSVWELLVECWNPNPVKRPLASSLLAMLETRIPNTALLEEPPQPDIAEHSEASESDAKKSHGSPKKAVRFAQDPIQSALELPAVALDPPTPEVDELHIALEQTPTQVKHPFEQLPEAPDLSGQVTILHHKPIYSGPYSSVYRGELKRDGQQELVAIKVLNMVDGSTPGTTRRKLKRERSAWGVLRHPNIVPLLGFATDNELFEPFGALISPWRQRGDAFKFFSEHGPSLTIRQRIGLWKDVVAGVHHLHGHTPLLIHGDLKTRNILIDDSGRAQICDFGLIRIFLEEGRSGMTTSTSHTGTECYLSYELVVSEDEVRPTKESDIHAVGCIGLEFVFSQIPYSFCKKKYHGAICSEIRAGKPPGSRPKDLAPQLESTWTRLEECWAIEPLNRPTAASLLAWLEDLIASPLPLPDSSTSRIAGPYMPLQLDLSAAEMAKLASIQPSVLQKESEAAVVEQDVKHSEKTIKPADVEHILVHDMINHTAPPLVVPRTLTKCREVRQHLRAGGLAGSPDLWARYENKHGFTPKGLFWEPLQMSASLQGKHVEFINRPEGSSYIIVLRWMKNSVSEELPLALEIPKSAGPCCSSKCASLKEHLENTWRGIQITEAIRIPEGDDVLTEVFDVDLFDARTNGLCVCVE